MAVSATNIRFVTGFTAFATLGANSPPGYAGSPWRPPASYTQPYFQSSGTALITKIGFKAGTLAFGATVTIDLTALDSPDGGSGTISLASFLCCGIQITSTTGKLKIGGNAAGNTNLLDFGANTDTRTILPAGPGHFVGDPAGVGYTVDGTHKNVLLTNSHASLSADYYVIFGGN